MPTTGSSFQMSPARAVVVLGEDGTTMVMRDVTNWSMDMSVETLDHYSARNGMRQVDHQIVTGMTFNLSATAHQAEMTINDDNQDLVEAAEAALNEDPQPGHRVIRFQREEADP